MRMRILQFILITLIAFCSCSSLDGVNERLDRIESQILDLQNAIRALQAAYDDGKIVKGVTPLQSGNGGWVITFSDNTAINL